MYAPGWARVAHLSQAAAASTSPSSRARPSGGASSCRCRRWARAGSRCSTPTRHRWLGCSISTRRCASPVTSAGTCRSAAGALERSVAPDQDPRSR
eukprot:scaffold21273_cov61-Phaeocystis_antarctica.AAC.1